VCYHYHHHPAVCLTCPHPFPKASSPQGAIYSFLFQMSVSSHFLNVIQDLFTSSSSSSFYLCLSFYLSINNVLQDAISTRDMISTVNFRNVTRQFFPLYSFLYFIFHTVFSYYTKYIFSLVFFHFLNTKILHSLREVR